MKNRIAVFLLFACVIMQGCSQSPKSSPFMKCTMPVDTFKGIRKTWVLIVTSQSKKQYIDSVTAAWKKDSIDLNFSELKYDAEGTLIKVKGTVYYTHNGSNVNGSFGPESPGPLTIKLDDRPSIDLRCPSH